MTSRGRSAVLLAGVLFATQLLVLAAPASAERPVYVTPIAIFNGWGQALAPDGGVVVTGAGSDQFQATPGAWDETPYDPDYPWNDAFVQKLDATGRTVWATWIGASGSDQGQNVTVGDDGSVYVAGYSSWGGSADFPTTPGTMSSDYVHGTAEVAWLMKFNRGGRLAWSTLVPGARYVHDLAADGQGRLHITGEAYDDLPVTAGAFDQVPAGSAEGFVATVAADGSAFEAASYLGGSGMDTGLDIALGPDDSAYVAAGTESDDAPTTDGAFDRTHGAGSDVLVAHVAADGETLLWSSYLGGAVGKTRPQDANEYVQGITVDHDGAPVVSGTGAATDFPTTPDAAYPEPPDASPPSWVTKFAADGSALEWSTFLPATVREGHLDVRGHTRLVGLAPTPGFAGDSAAWTVLIDLDRRGGVDRVTPVADQMAYDYDVDKAGSSYILSAPRPASSYARAATTAPAATLSRIPECTIRGTAGPDDLVGTPGPDVICAGGGDDVVSSGGGYDVILLGPGNDRVRSGDGVDVVHGGAGDDRIAGGTARDLLLGQGGADVLRGGDGPDSLLGGGGADRLYGEAGRDEILGGAGTDTVVP